MPTLRCGRGRSSSIRNNHRPFPIHQDPTPSFIPSPPQRRNDGGRSYLSSYSTTHVQKGMDRWINEFVMTYKICPYAKGSSYSIHVWSHQELETKGGDGAGSGGGGGGKSEESILDFCHQHVPTTLGVPPSPTSRSTDRTGTTSVWHRPNVFLCFPNVPEFHDYLSFLGFYQALMHVLPHVAGDNPGVGDGSDDDDDDGDGGDMACHHSDDDNQERVWQSFVFHPHYTDMVTDQPNWRFRAPFPSLHFIPLADLHRQRQKQPKKSWLVQGSPPRTTTTTTTTTTTMSKAIFQRNVITLQQSNVVETLQQIIQDAREGQRRID